MPLSIIDNLNRVRYTYYKADFSAKTKLEKRVAARMIASSTAIYQLLELDFGSVAITNANSTTISFDITFDERPTIIASTTDNISLHISSITRDTAVINSNEDFTGTIYWLAINKTETGDVRRIAILADFGTEVFTNQSTKTIQINGAKVNDFKLAAARYGLTPIYLVSSDNNVNLYLSSVQDDRFTVNASETFSGNVYWAGLMIRKI